MSELLTDLDVRLRKAIISFWKQRGAQLKLRPADESVGAENGRVGRNFSCADREP